MSVGQKRLVALTAAVVLALLVGCGGSTTTVTTSVGPSVRDACPPPIQRDDPAHEIDRVASPACVTALDAEQARNALTPPQPSVLGIGPLTTFSNGNLPSSALSPATGCVNQLANTAAAAWNHVAVVVHDHTGYWLQSNGSASCYRTFAQQVELRNYWCGQGNCGNAAVPGTSNHGWGLAVDAPPTTVSMIHRYAGGLFGQGYGSCSDAPWESWHIKFCGGYSGPDPGPYGSGGGGGFHVLKRGSHGPRVKKIQNRLFWLHDAGAPPDQGYLIQYGFRTGFYGKHTAYAVHKLQHDGKLTVDGKFGPKTAQYLSNRWKHFCANHAKPC